MEGPRYGMGEVETGWAGLDAPTNRCSTLPTCRWRWAASGPSGTCEANRMNHSDWSSAAWTDDHR